MTKHSTTTTTTTTTTNPTSTPTTTTTTNTTKPKPPHTTGGRGQLLLPVTTTTTTTNPITTPTTTTTTKPKPPHTTPQGGAGTMWEGGGGEGLGKLVHIFRSYRERLTLVDPNLATQYKICSILLHGWVFGDNKQSIYMATGPTWFPCVTRFWMFSKASNTATSLFGKVRWW